MRKRMTTLARYDDPVMAGWHLQKLQSAGIDASLTGAEPQEGPGPSGVLLLRVKSSEASEARELLDSPDRLTVPEYVRKGSAQMLMGVIICMAGVFAAMGVPQYAYPVLGAALLAGTYFLLRGFRLTQPQS